MQLQLHVECICFEQDGGVLSYIHIFVAGSGWIAAVLIEPQVEVMHTQFRVSEDHKLRAMLKRQSAKVR